MSEGADLTARMHQDLIMMSRLVICNFVWFSSTHALHHVHACTCTLLKMVWNEALELAFYSLFISKDAKKAFDLVPNLLIMYEHIK